MTKKQLLGLVVKIFPVIFYTLLLVFLGVYLFSIDYSQFLLIEFSWPFFILASILGMSFRYWSAYIWIVLLRSLGATSVRLTKGLLHVYAKSWLGRYIPGTAPWILSKIYFASKHGISKNKLATSSLLEGALQIAVQLWLASLFLLLSPILRHNFGELLPALFISFVVSVIVIIPPVFNRVIAFTYKVVKKKQFPKEHLATNNTIIRGFSMHLIGALLSGLSLFFVAKTIYPQLDSGTIIYVMGVSSFASAVSMIAIFAPGGIGVREAIQLTLLGAIMPTELAFTVTVFTRLWVVALDLLFYAANLRSHLKLSSEHTVS